MIKSVAVAVGLMLAGSAANAQLMMGYGTASCGQWSESRKKRDMLDEVQQAWVLGYLSAFNKHGPGKGGAGRNTDLPGMMAWLDNYCREKPLQKIYHAADALAREVDAK